ncbi:MAG: 50S ribosomal protein L13 [Alphaproteobacteria bacterium 40-19]|nr:MAG: 50S ribosomal protein L13 [Alphaproteobacteria bacterium 40-19]
MKTFSLKAGNIEKRWYVVDVEGVVLGRVASLVAKILKGKHKPSFTPHLDAGDRVVVVNAAKVRLTGDKREDKIYYWHTGHPGGIKSRTARQILDGRFPERVFEKAVERMLGRNTPMRRQRMKSLFIYGGAEHVHQAQSPEVLDVRSWNVKNSLPIESKRRG